MPQAQPWDPKAKNRGSGVLGEPPAPLTALPVSRAMSRNLAKTPEAVRAGGGSMSLWVLRLFSATSPTSPFSAASARTDSSCRPWGAEGEEQGKACGGVSTLAAWMRFLQPCAFVATPPDHPTPNAHPLVETAR